MYHHTATILRHNNKFTSGMLLLEFQQVYASAPYLSFLSSIRLVIIFLMQQNHVKASIFCANSAAYLDTTKLFKVLNLHYCQRYVLDTYNFNIGLRPLLLKI